MLPGMAGILAAAQILVLARRWFLHMKHQQVGLHTIVPTSARPDEHSPSPYKLTHSALDLVKQGRYLS